MSERLPTPAELLRGRGFNGRQDNAEVHRLMRMADRGDYLEAADEAASLLRTSKPEPRLTAVYLAGSFVERGPAGLPDLLDCLAAMLEREGVSLAHRDAALKWLMRSLTSHIAFHTAQRDETWERWIHGVSAQEVESIASKAHALSLAHPDGAMLLAKLGRWAEHKLSPASARVRKPEPEPEPESQPAQDPKLDEPSWDEPEPEPEPEAEEAEEAEEPEPGPDPEPELEGPEAFVDLDEEFGEERDPFAYFDEPAEPPPPRSVELPSPREAPPLGPLDSPAMRQLQAKVRGFEQLAARGELDKAAIIAKDVQATLDNFDPLVYLPALFGRYFQHLAPIIEELEARWDDESSRARVLEQFYRADLEAFVED